MTRFILFIKTWHIIGLSCLSIIMFSSFQITMAQSAGATTSNIEGIVEDTSKAVIGGAIVTVKNLSTGQQFSVTTPEDGTYTFYNLIPDIYVITVTAGGFEDKKLDYIDLPLGSTILCKFSLQPQTIKDNFELVSPKLAIESSGDPIRLKTLTELPINRRRFLDFAIITARVIPDGLPEQGVAGTSRLSANGQSARANNINTDGLGNNDFTSGTTNLFLSQGSVQEFQVIPNNYSAEFGRSLSAIINIITKHGSNDYNASLFLFNQNDKISARDAFTTFKPNYSQYQFGATVAGPIKKEKAFFFSSFERLTVKQNNIVSISDEFISAAVRQGFSLKNGPLPFSLNNTSFLTRLDLRIGTQDNFWVRYNFNGAYNGALEPFGALIGETNGGIQRLNENTIALNNLFYKTNVINETRFLYSHRDENILPINTDVQVQATAPEGFVTFGRGTFLPQPRETNTYQIVNITSLKMNNHFIKFGFDFEAFHYPKESTKLPILAGGLAIFSPIDFAELTGIPGLPSFSLLQSFDPTLRTSAQRSFLTLAAAQLPGMFPGFPTGLPLANLSLPLAYAQGFGDASMELSGKLFSTFIQDDIKQYFGQI